MNGLTVDVRASGSSSGATYKPDYTITFAEETILTEHPGEKTGGDAKEFAHENGATGEDTGEATYDPNTEQIENTGGGQPEWDPEPISQADGTVIVPAGAKLTYKNVRTKGPR
jgi:hypothetical protein